MRSEQEIREAVAGWEDELEASSREGYPDSARVAREHIAALRWVLAERKAN